MADFVAVLRKTIDAQADQSPELRQRVYAKARSTIEQKLVTANASPAVAVRQRKILEDAIDEVEAFYAPPQPAAQAPQRDALEDFLVEANQGAFAGNNSYDDESPASGHLANNEQNDWGVTREDRKNGDSQRNDEWMRDREEEHAFARQSEYADAGDERKGRSYKGLIYGLIALLVLGGAGYATYANKDKLQEFASSLGRKDAPEQATTTPETSQSTTTTDNNNQPAQEQPAQQPPAGEQKMTQRLMPDGSEVDPGGSGSAPTIGEGTSTAASTPGASPENNQNAAAQQPVAAGQQAFLYEERGGTETGSVEKGTVVWSVISESPEEGQPAQPAIRANIAMPESKMELKMTFRKNTDQSIPASHLIEMIFTVPEDFGGGVVDNVQRITFKDTEQAAGNPLVAVPSKIADNFFIVWLNDARTAQDTNLSLMRRLQWIDIPISYRNGRRALISLEKGPDGDRAFKEVLGSS